MRQKHFVVVFLCLCAIEAKSAIRSEKDAVITEYVNENDYTGNYVYGFVLV